MEDLILNNMGMVYHVIDKKFEWFHRWDNAIRDDLASEGVLALIYAAERFDPSCGMKFGNFAHDPIFWQVRKYVNKQLTNRDNGLKPEDGPVKVDSYDAGIVVKEGEEASTLGDILGGKQDDFRGLMELWELIKESGVKDIELIAQRRDEGYNYQDIGDELGVSREIIRRRIDKLKAFLSDYYDLEGMKPERVPNMYKWDAKKKNKKFKK